MFRSTLLFMHEYNGHFLDAIVHLKSKLFNLNFWPLNTIKQNLFFIIQNVINEIKLMSETLNSEPLQFDIIHDIKILLFCSFGILQS